MEEHSHENGNGTLRWSIIATCIIGALSIITSGVILILEEHPEHAVIYIGLLTAITVPTIGSILTVAGLRKNADTLKSVVVQTNSRMDELIAAAEKVAYAAGALAEHKAVAMEKEAEKVVTIETRTTT
jgi:hypothetical protein